MVDWPEIVRTHGPLVWRTAYRLLGDGADAADCWQKTFISALEVRRRGEVRNWPGLLKRIATQRALDQLRQRIRLRGKREDDLDLSRIPDIHPDPVATCVAKELAVQLRQALAVLPAQQAEVFALRELDGMSYRDIAEATGMEVSAVGVTLHRARRRLRDLLAAGNVSPGE